MVKAAWGGAADADVVVLLIEANRGLTEGAQMIIDRIRDQLPSDKPVALAINKIDRVKAEHLLALTQKMNEAFAFTRTFMISAERGHGVEMMKEWLGENLPESPWYYPEDQLADAPMRLIAAEMTREKLTLRLHEELPYQLTVETEKWEDRADGSTRIDQIIYVARDGHKGIILGSGGETIKQIGHAARIDITEFLGRTVHLFLRVIVRTNWLDEKERYSEMGLDFKDGDA
jgi:GTP-binding protein Era